MKHPHKQDDDILARDATVMWWKNNALLPVLASVGLNNRCCVTAGKRPFVLFVLWPRINSA